MKKLFSTLLAIAMCMALALPAFAGDNDQTGGGSGGSSAATVPTNRKTDYTLSLEEPIVHVTVPSAAAVKLNPYQIKVTDEDMGANNATGSILATTMYLANKSNVPLKMSLVATGSIPSGSNATFATAAPEATEKNRKVFMFIDVGAVTEGAAPEDATLSNVTYDASKTTQGVIKASDLKMNDILTIPVPGTDNGNYVPVSIGGACATTPTEAWGASDVVGLSITFTFVATNNTVAAATPANP